MKKTLAMLLALVMLFSLCACDNSNSQPTDPSNSSQTTTEGTEGTTGATQAPTGKPTTAPTEKPTTAPTTQPTEAPTTASTTPPTTCSHSYKDATCTALPRPVPTAALRKAVFWHTATKTELVQVAVPRKLLRIPSKQVQDMQ